MARARTIAAAISWTLACQASDASEGDGTSTADASTSGTTTSTTSSTSSTSPGTQPTTEASSDDPVTTDGDTSTTEPVPTGPTLEVRYLGVGGFSLRYGDDLVLTAPLYSNPDVLEVQFGSIEPDLARIDAFLADDFVVDAAAILVGHAHYDHLLDVPPVWAKTDHALVLGNAEVAELMALAGLPDEAMISLDDPELAWVDMRNCSEADPCTGLAAGNEGDWLALPRSNVRVRALCSSHPAQVLGVFHFGEGCTDPAPTELPTSAAEWKEGATLAYLVDFLDETGAPVFRVYAQDSPTSEPVGFPVAELLDDKRIDLALLNVGSYENVVDHPTAFIAATEPRYVVGGHWENFFRAQDQPLMEIPFAAPAADFDAAAMAALPGTEAPMVIDGEIQEVRYVRPNPGVDLEIAAEG